MTEPTEHQPDRVVETALRLLPVPDHGPAFWDRVDAALAEASDRRIEPVASTSTPAEVPAAPTTDPVPVVALEPVPALGVVPPAMRRPSNLVLSALAVAAAVAVVVAGSTLLRSRTADDPDDEVAEATADDTGATEDPPPEPLALSAPGDEPGVALVVDWLGALAAGDLDAAWHALGPASQAHWGSSSAFAAERTAFAEGYGAWAATPADQVIITPLVDGELEVVTLVGTVPQEGRAQARADAFPVRWAHGDPVLELYASAGPVEIVAPGAPPETGGGRSLATTDEIVVVVPEDGPEPLLRIDDLPAVTCGEDAASALTALEGTSARRCGYHPEGLDPGEHVLTVAYWSADGTAVTAHSVRFTVL